MKKLAKKCVILSFIMSVFSSIFGNAIAVNVEHEANKTINKDTEIAIYQFYFNPFGFRCNKSKEYISDLLMNNKDLKNVAFNIINVQDQAPEKLIPGYTSPHKNVVIMNIKTKKFVVSKTRELIGLGWTKEQIQKVVLKEIESVK